jgi:hypothetical protein
MKNLWGTAERLREVQAAHKQFVTLWAIDQANRLLEMQFEASRKLVLGDDDQSEIDAAPADVARPDWRGLYRGSVLDD